MDPEIPKEWENVRFVLILTIWSWVADKNIFLSVSRTLFKHHVNQQINPLANFTCTFEQLSFLSGLAVTHKESFKKSLNN